MEELINKLRENVISYLKRNYEDKLDEVFLVPRDGSGGITPNQIIKSIEEFGELGNDFIRKCVQLSIYLYSRGKKEYN